MNVRDLNTSEYGSFYQPYIDICGEKELLEELTFNLNETSSFLLSIPTDRTDYRYDTGKWTIKELLQHLIDSERIFAYRALRFARNDKTELKGYDHNNYVPEAISNRRDYSELIEEYISVRKASIFLFKSFTEEMLLNSGIANSNGISVRAIGFIMVGHCKHHCQVITERYL